MPRYLLMIAHDGGTAAGEGVVAEYTAFIKAVEVRQIWDR